MTIVPSSQCEPISTGWVSRARWACPAHGSRRWKRSTIALPRGSPPPVRLSSKLFYNRHSRGAIVDIPRSFPVRPEIAPLRSLFGRKAFLFGGENSLFAKLGNFGRKSLVGRGALCANGRYGTAFCRIRCNFGHREFWAAPHRSLPISMRPCNQSSISRRAIESSRGIRNVSSSAWESSQSRSNHRASSSSP